MSDESTPEQRLLAAADALARAAGRWLAGAWSGFQPVLRSLEELGADPSDVRQRQLQVGLPFRPACHCRCGLVHPGEPVCDANAVTTVRQLSDVTGWADVSVCAPCAAEVMTQP